jgi:hypothetical protein
VAVSSLAIGYAEILEQMCIEAHGIGDTTRLPVEAKERLIQLMKSGTRKAYYPSTVDPAFAHQWSFLTPRFTLPIESGKSDYVLPADWGGIQGSLNFGSEDQAIGLVRKVSVDMLLRKRSYPEGITGQPELFAEAPRMSSGMADQQWELLIWPEVDSSYTLSGSYRVHPNAMGEVASVPYGGVMFAETILEACLAEVENRLLREPGIHTANFRERLLASIQFDSQQHTPDTLGYNGDRTHYRRRQGVQGLINNIATVDSVFYDG